MPLELILARIALRLSIRLGKNSQKLAVTEKKRKHLKMVHLLNIANGAKSRLLDANWVR